MISLRNNILDAVLKRYGVVPEYLFESSPRCAVLRNKRNAKWFGIIMNVSADKLGLSGDSFDIINIKCNQDTLFSFLGTDGFLPAYHMNKTHWMTILLDGRVELDLILALLDMSFKLIDMTGKKKHK